eukprot:s3272_g10.t1
MDRIQYLQQRWKMDAHFGWFHLAGGKGQKPRIGCASTFLNRRLVPPVALPMDMLKACVEDLQGIVDRLSAHRRSQEDVLSLAVRVAGKDEPVMGKLRPKQVLQGIRSLLAPEPCNRTMVAWQQLLARQHFEYLQTSLEGKRESHRLHRAGRLGRRIMVRRKVKAKEPKDVDMTPKDSKVKKTINKSQRRKKAKAAGNLGARLAESRKQRRKRIASSAGGRGESAEQLKSRQATEWKEMKAQVAQLKKVRQKLPRRGSKEQKEEVSKQIRQLQEDMQVRHVAELKAAGLDADTGKEDMDL